MKITNWRTETVYIDQDTGEVLKATNERQLKYLNYIKTKTIKKTEINENIGIIRLTNFCRFTGQRTIKFDD